MSTHLNSEPHTVDIPASWHIQLQLILNVFVSNGNLFLHHVRFLVGVHENKSQQIKLGGFI